MRFHGMAELLCFLKINSIHHRFPLIKSQYPYGIFICPAPYWQGVCRAGWLVRSIARNRERFLLPARSPACCSGCPHRAEVSLWLPLGLPAMGSPAPDAACCLPSPVTVFRFTPYGASRSWRSSLSGATLSRGNLLKPLHTGIQLSNFLHSGGKPVFRIQKLKRNC